jgi:hypothetical protein
MGDQIVMTGAHGVTDRDVEPGHRWDVALSFAGAQRDYVEQVASVLTGWGVRCFYDADEQIELWGKYLAEELPVIYGEQAAAVVVFVSAEYAARDWTRHERRAALNRAVRERREYVLPARFDDTPLPGLLSDMVTVDLRTRTPEQFAAMIAAKLAALDITVPDDAADAGNLEARGASDPARRRYLTADGDVPPVATPNPHQWRLDALAQALDRIAPGIFRDPRISAEALSAASTALLSISPLVEALTVAAGRETLPQARFELQQLDGSLRRHYMAVAQKLAALNEVALETVAEPLCRDLATERVALITAGTRAILRVT